MNQSAMIRTLQPVIPGAVSTEPVSLCTHPRHVEWWNCPVEQPASQFYPHTNKCKRCYIRQQQVCSIATERYSPLMFAG